MLAVRQRAAGVAHRARPTAITRTAPRQAKRSYASDHGHGHDHHHHGHNVEEKPGKALYIALGGFATYFAVYQVKAAMTEDNSLTKWLQKDAYAPNDLEANARMIDTFEQAASDRMLFLSVERRANFELRTPELFNAGNTNNVPAGHQINLDKVIEHYRKQYHEEEERKAKALAAAKK